MICAECKKKFQNPLILFTGDRVCPGCLKSMFPVVTVPEITEENHRMFTLAEDTYYTGYLLNNAASHRGESERRHHLDEAIKLCREAARLKNPYAMLRLGYYHTENFIKDATTDNFNRVAAINLYEQLANANEVYLRDYIVDGVTEEQYPLPPEEVDALRKEAKRRLTQLKARQNTAGDEEPAVKVFMSTLRAMREGNGRTPLFAVFKLDRERLFDALADEVSGSDSERAAKSRALLNGTANSDADERLKHRAISDIAKLFGKVEIGVRTNNNYSFMPLGDRSGGTYFKWEPFFRGTTQWVTTEYGREYGYFYLINTAAKSKLLDIKRLSAHLRKHAPLYVSDEMMSRSDRCIFYADDFYYHFRRAGMPAYGKRDLSASLIENYLESR